MIDRRGPWHKLQAVERATLALGVLLKAAASLSGLLRCCSQGVDWLNNRRLLQPIGNTPPAEAEAAFHDALETESIAASDSNQPASGKPGAVQQLVGSSFLAQRARGLCLTRGTSVKWSMASWS